MKFNELYNILIKESKTESVDYMDIGHLISNESNLTTYIWWWLEGSNKIYTRKVTLKNEEKACHDDLMDLDIPTSPYYTETYYIGRCGYLYNKPNELICSIAIPMKYSEKAIESTNYFKYVPEELYKLLYKKFKVNTFYIYTIDTPENGKKIIKNY